MGRKRARTSRIDLSWDDDIPAASCVLFRRGNAA
jgi:hypothetical protein